MRVKDLNSKLQKSIKISLHCGTNWKIRKDISEKLVNIHHFHDFKILDYNVEEESDKWFSKFLGKRPEFEYDEELESDMKSMFKVKFKKELEKKKIYRCEDFDGVFDEETYVFIWKGYLYDLNDVKEVEKYVSKRLNLGEEVKVRILLDDMEYDFICNRSY